jgi:transcriptional regulator with XRE-family HTH domain
VATARPQQAQAAAERPAEPSHIGAAIRERRRELGISLREIGGRIGVSASLISQIEHDKVTPSVSTLWALVTELGLTMGDVFADAEPAVPVRRAPATPELGLVTLPDERAVLNLASGVRWERLTAQSDPLVEFLYVVYDVGSASCDEQSLVRHRGTEYGYVISGRLGVRVGFDVYELNPGASISFDASAPHRLWAVGRQPAHAIWVVVGRQPTRDLL